MLQSIRDRTQGWFAGIIIFLLILSFALWGISSYFNGSSNNNIVAKVNGYQITKTQLAATYERMRRQLLSQYSTSSLGLPEKIENRLKYQALQTLISIQSLKQASLKDDYRVSGSQVDSYLASIPDFKVNGQFSMERFQQVLSSTLLSIPEFLDLVHTNLLVEQPRLGMIFSSFALPNEITEIYSLVEQTRDIDYSVIPFSKFSRESIKISDSAAQTYYQQHENDYHTPEQVSISYIQLSQNDLTSKIQPNEQTLVNYYNENSSSYSTPALWKLDALLIPAKDATIVDEIVKKAKQGTDFAALIRENHTIKKPDAKLLNSWVAINNIPAEWQSVMVILNKPGQLSDPIPSHEGTVILKVIAYQEPKIQPYAQVKQKVKETYIHQQTEEKFAEIKEKLASLTYEHPESLDIAAKELKLPIKRSSLFTFDKGGQDITANNKIRSVAFSNEVLNQQNNSDVVQLNPDTIIVLRVNSHIPAALLPFNTVKNQIIERLKTAEIESKTLAMANDIIANPSKVQLSWNTLGLMGRHSNKVNPAILNTAFAMALPESGKPSLSFVKVSEGYAIVRLKSVKQGSLDTKNHNQYVVFAEQFQNTQGLLEYELYKQSQLNRAKVVINKGTY